jgi:multiple sugar transport system permease protein
MGETRLVASKPGVARETLLGWLLSAPALAVMALLAFWPVLHATWLSLHRVWRQAPHSTVFVGLDNYAGIVTAWEFWNATANTLIFTAASVGLELVIGTAFAMAMHHAGPFRGVVRASVLVPWALPTAVAALLWAWIVHDRYGVLNRVLLDVRLVTEPVVWLGGVETARTVIILADVWKTTPFVAVIILAGLQTIDPSIYEAAAIDGAGSWRRFAAITLPALRPAILVALLFRTLDAFRIFDLVYVLTRGGPGGGTETLSVLTYQTLFRDLDFGYGSALAVVMFLASAGISVVYVRLIEGKRRGDVW